MKLEELIDYPKWPRLPDAFITNHKHEINVGVAEQLRSILAVARYSARLEAVIWWNCERGYMAAVRRRGALIATFAAVTARQLRDEISEEFGTR